MLFRCAAAMEVNRDEAERCIDIAAEALTRDQPEKALRFLEKAQRLFPTEKAKALQELIAKNGFRPRPGNNHFNSTSEPRQRHPTARDEPKPEEKRAESQKSYTAEQVEAVRRIKQCKDFYEILGVQKDTSEDELKRSYRKLALKFHPDKNQAPGATEAFKAIGNAYAVLSNSSKRRQYDEYGEERTHPHRPGTNHDTFEADISPEDLFNMFFGGGYPTSNGHAYTHTRTRHQRPAAPRRERPRDGGLALFVQVMPILILVIVSALSQLMGHSPAYSLSYRPSAGYSQKRLTEKLKVPYFVGEQFSSEWSGANLQNLERNVEEDYVSNLRNNCWKEKQQKEGMLYRARYFGDSDLYERAQRARTPSCAKLSEISASFHH